jgi:hypothetical protein
MATVAAHEIVFFAIFLQAELENEAIFAGQAFEIARIQLCLLANSILLTPGGKHTCDKTMTTGPLLVTSIMNLVL